MPHTYTHMHISVFFPTDMGDALLVVLCEAGGFAKPLQSSYREGICKAPLYEGFAMGASQSL